MKKECVESTVSVGIHVGSQARPAFVSLATCNRTHLEQILESGCFSRVDSFLCRIGSDTLLLWSGC